jgi:hypothetical protein
VAQLTNVSDQAISIEWDPTWSQQDPTITPLTFDRVVWSLFQTGALTLQPGQVVTVPDNLAAVLETDAGLGVIFSTYSYASLDLAPAPPSRPAGRPMRLEAVQTCVGYADFLAALLPRNKHLFDKIVVVTTPDDLDTRRLCEYLHVECVQTNAFHRDGAAFAKGDGINAGLEKLSLDGWVVHLDADIVLPPLFRDTVLGLDLDDTHVYGCDRYIIPHFEAWQEHVNHPRLEHENGVYVHADAYKIGTRIAPPQHGGYIPIGFFQMWGPRGSGRLEYPTQHTTAARTDMLFALQWDRRHRGFLPEVIAYHLESDPDAPQGANWEGRHTPPFEPDRHPVRRWCKYHHYRRRRRGSWCSRRRHHRHHHRHHHPVPPVPPVPYVNG